MRCRICRREHFQTRGALGTRHRKCCVSLPRISFNFASISLSQQLCSWKMLLAGWGMSEKTLARRLSDEGLNFTEILQRCVAILQSVTSTTASCMYRRSRGCSASRGERIHECVQALDRKDAEPDADNLCLVSPKPTHCARFPRCRLCDTGQVPTMIRKGLVFHIFDAFGPNRFAGPQPRTTPIPV